MKNWFEVDKHGLAKILERKGKEFVLFELIQNAWDEAGVSSVSVALEYKGRNKALLVVEDDAPEGFQDLSHAFTLFAESTKKANPQQRGRFNLGEKLVLAISDEVTISTTKGGIRFDADGRRTLRTRQAVGSRIECFLRMTEDECRAILVQVRKLICPAGIATTFNGALLESQAEVREFSATLPTEVASGDGFLRRVNRETTVRLFTVQPGETAMVYEMGIPVVETGDKWHYEIGQKVPLTIDRENVPPSFLRQVRVAVFNQMHEELGSEVEQRVGRNGDCVNGVRGGGGAKLHRCTLRKEACELRSVRPGGEQARRQSGLHRGPRRNDVGGRMEERQIHQCHFACRSGHPRPQGLDG